MTYHVYILKSESSNKSYIGQTANLEKRLWEHNNGKSLSTRRKSPWKLVYSEEFQTRSDAVMRESYFKTVDGRMELKSKGIL
jgi:putative endonuclease